MQIRTFPIKIAFPTDEHRPFHDPKAVNLAQQIVRDFQPDIRVTGSDGLDFYSISHFDKDPTRVKEVNLQDEIDSWKKGQREWLDAAPNAQNIFIIGNHEDRLRRYLWRKAPELAGLKALSLSSILDFDALNILPTSEDEIVFGDQLVVRHGSFVRKSSGFSAKAELEKDFYSISTMTGHTHRGGVHYARTRKGVVQGHECFCLCDLNPEYVRNPNWQQGIVLAEVRKDHLSIEPIPFFRAGGRPRANWRGKQYIGV